MEFTKLSEISGILSKIALGMAILPREQALIDRWLEESPRNKVLFHDLTNSQSVGREILHANTYPPREAVKSIAATLRRNKRRRIATWYSSAAAMIILALSFTLFLPNRQKEEETGLAILPARVPQAILSVNKRPPVAINEDNEGTAWRAHLKATPVSDEDIPAEDPVSLIRIEVPRGSEYKVHLDDGTSIWLNSESSIEYPARFTGVRREVRLSGEGYFEVSKNERHPFVITVGDTKITVLGTSFNISAYDGDSAITATLATGLIDVASSRETTRLTPGKQAIIGKETGDISVSVVDPRIYTSWITGIFEFDGMELTGICAQLARWYDIEFVFEGNSGTRRFTGAAWRYKPLSDFLENIEQMTHVSFEYRDGKVVVKPK